MQTTRQHRALPDPVPQNSGIGSEVQHVRCDEPEGYDQKSDFVDWVLERGFRDVAHGVRSSLEEAYLYIDIALNAPQLATWGELKLHLENVRKEAGRMNFVQLMDAVNAGLTEPLTFEEEFLSLQKVRNCLEHRHSIVTDKDVDHPNGMRLSLPRLKIFFIEDDKEVDVAVGQYFIAETVVSIRRDTKERFFSHGSRVFFSATEFDEIARASYFFANDLVVKLPGVAAHKSSAIE